MCASGANVLRITTEFGARDFLEFAANPLLDPPNSQERNSAGLEFVADLELRFPDPRRCRLRQRVFYASVDHGESPAAMRHIRTRRGRVSHLHMIFSGAGAQRAVPKGSQHSFRDFTPTPSPL